MIEYKKANKILTDELYNKMKNKGKDLNWWDISQSYILSEEIIKEFKNYVCWNWISRCQILSEDFIREFKDCVDWIPISKYQNISEPFIKEFQNDVDWEYILKYQNISYEFIIEFLDRIRLRDLKQNKYLQEKLTEPQWRTIEFLKK